MGKLSLKAKNPFGKDIEMFSTKTWIGLGAFAVLIASVTAMVTYATTGVKRATKGIDALHARLGEMG